MFFTRICTYFAAVFRIMNKYLASIPQKTLDEEETQQLIKSMVVF